MGFYFYHNVFMDFQISHWLSHPLEQIQEISQSCTSDTGIGFVYSSCLQLNSKQINLSQKGTGVACL